MWCHRALFRVDAAIIGRVAFRAATKTDGGLAARLAALASVGAAVIHFAVVPNHWQEWMPAGLFFAAIALFQLIWAGVVLAKTTIPVLAAGITLNIGAIALWAVSRTAGAPFGPHAGEAELIQAADLCALLLQIYVVMGAGWVWYRGRRPEPIAAYAHALVFLGAAGVVALASTVGVASGLRHGHHAPPGAEQDHHSSSIEHADAHQEHHSEEPAAPSPAIESNHTPPVPAPLGTPISPAEPAPDSHDAHDHGE